LRLLEKLDNLLELFLRFFHPGHVFERHTLLLIIEQLRARLAERQRLVAARLHLPQHEDPDRYDE
jgi:mannose/cellobiose epimerase-like protein (N-acyl-D-glucosamine 2-epimerase family)